MISFLFFVFVAHFASCFSPQAGLSARENGAPTKRL
jgi:hypothetical protein